MSSVGSPGRRLRKSHRGAIKRIRTQIYERDNFTCVYCGWYGKEVLSNPLRYKGGIRILTIDHEFPLCLGGQSTMENLKTACSDCNSAKSVEDERNVEAYRVLQGRYPSLCELMGLKNSQKCA